MDILYGIYQMERIVSMKTVFSIEWDSIEIKHGIIPLLNWLRYQIIGYAKDNKFSIPK